MKGPARDIFLATSHYKEIKGDAGICGDLWGYGEVWRDMMRLGWGMMGDLKWVKDSGKGMK